MSASARQAELIPLSDLTGETDPDEWLEWARKKLKFRSHCAMHRALAEATGLKYSTIHKALSGRDKANRIRSPIKKYMDRWLEKVEEGKDINVDDEHRAVPVERLQKLLPRLNRKFRTKEEMYRCIAKHTSAGLASVRRYFLANGDLKHAPLSVFRFARKLARQLPEADAPDSYLSDERIRQTAGRIAEEANEALRYWRSAHDSEARSEYKDLRYDLIATLKKQQEARKASA
mgnify:CR=1 FL=1